MRLKKVEKQIVSYSFPLFKTIFIISQNYIHVQFSNPKLLVFF